MAISTDELKGTLSSSNINGTVYPAGPQGTTGVGITSIEKTLTSGLIDTYTITFSDNSTTTFNVTNGANGTNGINGSDGKSLEFNWSGTQLGVRVAGTTDYTYVDLKGDKGDTGISDIATTTSNGLMSSTDKSKLDGIDAEANKTIVDTSLSSTSSNPIANSAVTTAIDTINTNGVIGATQYGGTIISASEDLNNITKSGFYTCYGTTTNAPSTSYSWFIIHENSNAGVVTAVQTAKAYSTSLVIRYRLKIGSTWGSWIDPNASPTFTGTPVLPTSTLIGSKTIINLIYPVGSIYMSVNSISPSDLFGGTWTQINGRFLYCSTTSKTTGGNTTTGSTALTIEQIPSHNHAVQKLMPVNYNVGTEGWDADGKAAAYLNSSDYFKTSFVGEGQGHTHPQNLPPFFTVYCWYRTA